MLITKTMGGIVFAIMCAVSFFSYYYYRFYKKEDAEKDEYFVGFVYLLVLPIMGIGGIGIIMQFIDLKNMPMLERDAIAVGWIIISSYLCYLITKDKNDS